jgi:hypothetical protein
MNELIAIILLTAPFVLVGAVVAFLIVTIGKRTSSGSR